MAAAYLCALSLLVCVSSRKCALVDASGPGGQTLGSASGRTSDAEAQDVVTANMYKIYDKYAKDSRQRQGNTVRSFRATPVLSNSRLLFQFNLSSIPESELVVAATLHFLDPPRPRPRPWSCRRPRGPPPCRLPPPTVESASASAAPPPPPPRLVLRGGLGSSTAPPAVRLAALPLPPHPRSGWLLRNISAPLGHALDAGLRLLTAEFEPAPSPSPADQRPPPTQQRRRAPWTPPSPTTQTGAPPLTTQTPPYLLVYADDRAIGEPSSVAATLQRYGPSPGPGHAPSAEDHPHTHTHTHGHTHAHGHTHTHTHQQRRPRREAEHLRNNLLPELQRHTDPKSKALWENTYFPLKPKPPKPHARNTHSHTPTDLPNTDTGREGGSREGSQVGEGGSQVGEGGSQTGEGGSQVREGGEGGSQVLRFDERVMKKARRRQWEEPRACARRYLRVDFADVGWSDWVLAPKGFQAYYCAGACRFPIAKMGRPSNHATIQSIVRAVGIIPGIPEPCCVPDKMSSLPVLYLDPDRNLVLKVYPGMSVDTCACR